MTQDAALLRSIIAALDFSLESPNGRIAVEVDDGVVYLTGRVTAFAHKRSAREIVESVRGVRRVVEELEVRLPAALCREDDDIREAILHHLDWDADLHGQPIAVQVQAGWVTLSGRVAWGHQKTHAADLIAGLCGVTGFNNQIAVSPPRTAPGDLTRKIEGALRRSWLADPGAVKVLADGEAVVLTGSVASAPERRWVELAALSAPGVTQVLNEVVVGGGESGA